MGVVDEYMVSHYFKRATMIGVLFGNTDYHMKRYMTLTQSGISSADEAISVSVT